VGHWIGMWFGCEILLSHATCVMQIVGLISLYEKMEHEADCYFLCFLPLQNRKCQD
jgi:hypothetical protein